MTGLTPRSSGSVCSIKCLAELTVNRAGLARTFQNIRLFREMSVVENLLVAQHMRVNRNLLAGIVNSPAYRRAESDALDRAFYWLEVVDLVDCANRPGGGDVVRSALAPRDRPGNVYRTGDDLSRRTCRRAKPG